ncbi:hypothetical protein [Pseudoalteromonas sp. bablab_jr004]|uniref:hypothetical protein n=1 Tax=Pseudoalteromonas sp. bablab_jr004 TaxID=2755065 RepID=UPI0018F7431F|nr:hypothetical protein [Pseudoalteromonas sp. bablab_jr004]
MFKKSLLAVALGVAAFGANAASTSATPSVVSLEGAVGQTTIAVPTYTIRLAAEYAVGDTFTITLTGAEFDTTSNPAITFAGFTNNPTVGLLSKTATTATFRVTAVPSPVEVFSGKDFVLNGALLKTTTVTDAAGDIKLAYAAKTSTGLDLDNVGTATSTVVTSKAQLSSSVTKALNGVIDVENERKQFTAGNDSITTDVLEVTPVVATAGTHDASYTGATHVIKGDFSWMDTDGTTGVSATELAAAFKATGTDGTYASTINTAGDAITVTVTDTTAETMTATFTVLGKANSKAPILSTQKFTVDSTIKYNTAGGTASTKAMASAEAGSWTLNGFDENIVFMPFGTQYAQSINVSNTGKVAGAITVDITADGKTHTKTLTATATPMATTNISQEVKAFAAEKGVTGNAHIKVVVNSPSADIDVTGVYYSKSDADRVKTK